MREEDALLDGLDDDQRQAATSDAAALCVVAGPGTGKTRVLTRRVAYRIASGTAAANRSTVLTFTRAAAAEVRGRLRALGVDGVRAGTFHGICLAIVTQRLRDTGRPRPNLITSRERLLRDVLRDAGETRIRARQLDAEIAWANTRWLDDGQYVDLAGREGRAAAIPAEEVAALMAWYRREKRSRGVVDFDDLLLRVVEELDADRAWANAQRYLHRHLYVDEFQDTSGVQVALLRRLATPLKGYDKDICVVGDPNQSIFGFSGVDPGNFDRFAEWFPGASRIVLGTNYRSTPAVAAAARRLVDVTLRPARADDFGPDPTVTVFPTDEHEARGIARALRDVGRPWSRIAVLARTNRALDLIEGACTETGVPVTRPMGLTQRPEVRRALREVRALPTARPVSALRADLTEIAEDVLAGIAGGEGADLLRADAELPLAAAVARHHLAELVELRHEFAQLDAWATIDDFLFWLEATAHQPTAARPARAGVELRTVHRAKGLEWRHVFVAGMEQGLFPLDGADPGEEERLAFVAFTRATDHLHCSWAQQRTVFDRVVPRTASPFLAALEVPATVDAGGRAPFRPADHIAALRRELARRRDAVTAGHAARSTHAAGRDIA